MPRCKICNCFLTKEGKCNNIHNRGSCGICGSFLDKNKECIRNHNLMTYQHIYKRNCDNCGKYYEGRGKQYCSSKCCCEIVSPFVKGHTYRHNNYTGPKNPWNKGLKLPKIKKEQSKGFQIRKCKNCNKNFETMWKKEQIFCSNSCANSMQYNSSWLGGISFEPYGLEFNNELKEQIRIRDNYTCQECNYTQKQLKRKLTVHHIDFVKQNNNPNNLISLCLSCHAKTNFNRSKWIEYYQEMVIPFAP